MTAPRDHADFDALAVGWTLHALEPGDEQAFLAHLPTCERCRQTVRESEDTLAEVSLATSPTPPPPELKQRIMSSIAATPDASAVRPIGSARAGRSAAASGAERRRRWLHSRPLQAAAAAVIVALVAGLTVWNVVLRQHAQHENVIAKNRQHLIEQLVRSDRKATLQDTKGHTVGYVVEHNGRLDVVTKSMQPNEAATTTYVLWATAPSTPPRAIGTFDVTSRGMALKAVGSPPRAYPGLSGYAVSKEPGNRAPKRPSDVVASGAVKT